MSQVQNEPSVVSDPLQAGGHQQTQSCKKKNCEAYTSYRSHRTVFSAFAIFSSFSLITVASFFSVASLNSLFSLLSVNGICSVLSVNSMFSVMSVSSMFSIGCVSKFGRFCWADDDYLTVDFAAENRLSTYNGTSTTPTGTVKLTFIGDNVTIEFNLDNVPTECETQKCPAHVHVGESCDAVGDHFWNTGEDMHHHHGDDAHGHETMEHERKPDPWHMVGYKSYNKFTINWGLDESAAKGRTMVLHDVHGTKLACAII